jgi:hypothetical protein
MRQAGFRRSAVALCARPLGTSPLPHQLRSCDQPQRELPLASPAKVVRRSFSKRGRLHVSSLRHSFQSPRQIHTGIVIATDLKWRRVIS